MGEAHPSRAHDELDPRLATALARLYMGDSTFPEAFRQEPQSAVKTLREAPQYYGPLRNYVGPLSLAANHKRVVRLLQQLTRRNTDGEEDCL